MDLPSLPRGVSAVGLLSMNIRLLALSFITLSLGLSQPLMAIEAIQTATVKPGYNVAVDVLIDETGKAAEVKVAESDDPTADRMLENEALLLALKAQQQPRMKDGKPVKFTVRVPFNFPVEGDEGAAANKAPKPSLSGPQTMPKFPENLVAKGENGGAILELLIGSFGNVQSVKVLNASHPEYADAAVAAVKTWTFHPAQKEGVNVDSRWRIALGFSADGKEIEWRWRVAPRPNLGGFTWVHPKLPLAAPATAPAAPIAPAEGSPAFTLPTAPATPAPAK